MRILSVFSLSLLLGAASASAQDRRPLIEPTFPSVCASIEAPLTVDGDGPPAWTTARDEDREASREAGLIQQALHSCPRGQAVRLTLGRSPAHVAFLIDPITVPDRRALIIDGGVTVFASRNPARYQIHGVGYVCGGVGEYWPVISGCRALITLNDKTGIYGFGVIDGQAQRGLIRDNTFTTGTWWDLLIRKRHHCRTRPAAGDDEPETDPNNHCQQASPPLVYTALGTGADDITIYKTTFRNPPFHTIKLDGHGITVWGAKVQAPWNVPNSDGFDLNGTNILVKDVTVGNGDQDIVLTSTGAAVTRYVTVDGATLYSKGGVALLDKGAGITDLVVNNIAMTGQVASFEDRRDPHGEGTVLINGQDPLTMPLRNSTKQLRSYGQALPTATGEIQGLQVSFNVPSALPTRFERISFRSVCLQDVVRPIMLPNAAIDPEEIPPRNEVPRVEDVLFEDIHVLAPSEQFPKMKFGLVDARGGKASYEMRLSAYPPSRFYNHITLDNVVFDDFPNGPSSLRDVTAVGNVIRTLTNVYPRRLNNLDRAKPPVGGWTLSQNSYWVKTNVSDPALAIPCPADLWPFLTGELYAVRVRPDGKGSSLPTVQVRVGDRVRLSAVVQPAMSQTTWFSPHAYGANPGLLSIGSPGLTKPVEFYEGAVRVGTGQLGANGTLAAFTIERISRGEHTYTARYPGDAYYKPYTFGPVRVRAR